MPSDLSVPGSVLQAIAPIRFLVLDERGTDVAALFADPERSASLADSTFVVPEAQTPHFRAHVLRSLPHIAGNVGVDDHVRAWLLGGALQFEVSSVLASTEQLVQRRGLLEVTRGLAREGASWASGPVPSYRHRDRLSENYSVVTHAVNSALYATSLAAAAGEDRQEVLQGVALAAVFADVGLDELDDAAGVGRAVAFLRRTGIGSVGAVIGVLARRTRWDGAGVPAIVGSAIPFEARCITISCDYDLLTLNSPRGAKVGPHEALVHMTQTNGVYDPTLLRVFIRMIGGVASGGTSLVVRGGSPRHPDKVREMLRALRIA